MVFFAKSLVGNAVCNRYSRLTGAMVISMTRRTEADCDVGHHAAVFDSCWSHADADASEFRGAGCVCVRMCVCVRVCVALRVLAPTSPWGRCRWVLGYGV